MRTSSLFIWCLVFFLPLVMHAKEIKTNEVVMGNAPDWLLRTRVEKITDRIQTKLEWSTRRVDCRWFSSQSEFESAHGLGSQAVAVTITRGGVSQIFFGPTITTENFDATFGHELVHVISNQKYKGAIPKWLEEGLANHLAHRGAVDYKWLAAQPFPDNVTQLAHPFQGSSNLISYRYKASQALAEMLQKKCDLENLIRLSVERKMETYIDTYCEIKDLTEAFKDWVKKRAKS